MKLREKLKRKCAMRERIYTLEQKEFILDCLACGYPYWEIQEEFEEEFRRKAPVVGTIAGYKERHTEEIEKRREEWRKDLKSSGLPYILQAERVKRYSRFAKIETRRKRYKEAREHLHEIALEVGDLKEKREHSGTIGLENISAEQRIDRLAELAEQIAGRSAPGDKGGA